VAHRPLDGAHSAPPTGSTGPATSALSQATTKERKSQTTEGGGNISVLIGGKLGVLLTFCDELKDDFA